MEKNPLYAEIDRLKEENQKITDAYSEKAAEVLYLRGLIEELFLSSLPAPAKEKVLAALRAV